MTYAGQSIKPFETRRLITGSGNFVGDIDLPGMLHAVVLRSDYAHARLKSIDTSAARAQPGVAAVLTGQDIRGILNAIPPPIMGSGRPYEDLRIPTHPLLATDQVCYVGQSMAVIVAESLALALDAMDHIQVDYEMQPALIDPFDALRDETPLLHPHLGTNVVLRVRQEGGDLDAAFAQADRVVRQRYEVPRQALVPLETRGVVAQYDAEADQLTVWNSNPGAAPRAAPFS